jgi:tRNA (cmo5U34)-methyltransferase
MHHDIPATLDAHLVWLREAGYTDVDCYYKYLSYAVFGGRKPA